MLILTRRVNETITIGDDIKVVVLGVNGSQVKPGVEAPKNVSVHRQEIYERIAMMKMNCEILGVESAGMKLRLKLPGRQQSGADWREWCSMTIEIPATEKSKRAFYIGRVVSLEIK